MGVSHPYLFCSDKWHLVRPIMTERKMLYASNLVNSVPDAVTLTFLVSYWRCDMKIRPGNATPNIVWTVYCVPGFWLFWWRWDWGERKESWTPPHLARAQEVAEVGPCLILISGPGSVMAQGSGPGAIVTRAREQPTLHGEQREPGQETRGLSAPVETVLSRAPTLARVRRAAGSSHNIICQE